MQPSPLPVRSPLLPAGSRLALAGLLLLSCALPLTVGAEPAQSCLSHDAEWHFPADAGQDDDGSLAVWVAAGPHPSDGSEKVSTSCLTLP